MRIFKALFGGWGEVSHMFNSVPRWGWLCITGLVVLYFSASSPYHWTRASIWEELHPQRRARASRRDAQKVNQCLPLLALCKVLPWTPGGIGADPQLWDATLVTDINGSVGLGPSCVLSTLIKLPLLRCLPSFILAPWQPAPGFLPGKRHGERSLRATVHGVTESRTWLSYCSQE